MGIWLDDDHHDDDHHDDDNDDDYNDDDDNDDDDDDAAADLLLSQSRFILRHSFSSTARPSRVIWALSSS